MKCSDCYKYLSNINRLVHHLEYSHKMKHNYECPVCSRHISRRDNFKKHFSSEHKKNVPPSENTISSLKFPDISFERSDLTNSNNSILDIKKPDEQFDLESKITSFLSTLEQEVTKIISKLHVDLTINRSFIQKTVVLFKEFLNSGFLSILKEFMFSSDPSDTLHLNKAKDLIDHVLNSFNLVDTEYKRLKVLENSNNYIEPIQKIIGHSQDVSRNDNVTSLVLKPRTCIFVPVSETLKKFIALPGVLKIIQEFQNQSYVFKNHEFGEVNYKNILNGSIWEGILHSTREKYYIPLFIYFDDFETSNPLGSHAGVYKVGAVYFSIASLPPEYISRLENIFLTLVFHSSERTAFGNASVFNCLLEDLKNLESTGILIESSGQEIRLYFAVVLIVGDNLGLNSILGFTESFSANNFCRLCTTHKSITKQQTQINLSAVRSEADYDRHVREKNYGIKESCIWNKLTYFHVCQNQSVDLMHDVYEGIHRYDMTLILNKLLQEKWFSLEILNSRVKYYTYDYNEHNHPPPVKKEHLENGMIIFSAAEMVCFVKNFRFFIGDLVPLNNETWLLYLSLLEITEILSASEISASNIEQFQNIITTYLNNLLKLFPTFTLKPKHHFLLHYPNILRKTGPVSKISSMRFEAKHRDLKKVANSVQSRRNIPLTLAKRCQMQFAVRCLSNCGLEDRLSSGRPNILNTSDFENYEFLNDFDVDYFKEKFHEVNWYEKNGVRYSLQDVVSCSKEQYHLIKHIFVAHDNINTCYLICQQLNVEGINNHYRSHIVVHSNQYTCVGLDTIICFPSVVRNIQNLKLVSISKYF